VDVIFAWLNANSGAITAIAAIAGVFVASVYTRITSRLAKIATTQTEILAAQQKLQSAQVKHMLYERRLKVFHYRTLY